MVFTKACRNSNLRKMQMTRPHLAGFFVKGIPMFKGKKTYLIAAIGAAIAVAEAFGIVIPAYVYPLLASLGLTTLRSAVNNVTQ